MKKIELCKNIDFNDSSFKCLELTEEGNLKIRIISWNEKVILIDFIDVIQFNFKLCDFIQGLFVVDDSSLFLDEAIKMCYRDIKMNQPYKHFQLLDIQDFPFLEVVAKEFKAISE